MRKFGRRPDEGRHQELLNHLLRKVESLMASVADLQGQVSALSTDVARVQSVVTALEAQVASGSGPASQADLDAIGASIKSVQDAVAAIK